MGQGQLKQKDPHSYQERAYRRLPQSGLMTSRVQLMETDLHIMAADRVDDPALALVAEARAEIERYIARHPEFLHALVPLPDDDTAPAIIRTMLSAARRAGVGPMAAVAGAVAECIGQGLEKLGHNEVIVENGGDIYVRREKACTIAIYAGESPLSGRVGIRLERQQMPCGVCTSSAAIGHSLSLGTSDAAVVIARQTAFADALATRLGNEVREGADGLNRALAVVKEIDGVTGAVVIAGEKLGAWGDLQLIRLQDQQNAS